MLTIHAADELRYGWDDAPESAVQDGAVAVRGDRVVGTGTLAELRERFPDARVRHWPGVLGPALLHQGPLPDAPTPRERVHAVLKLGATAVLEEHADTPELRAAAARNDVVVVPRGASVHRSLPLIEADVSGSDLSGRADLPCRADLAVLAHDDETGTGVAVGTGACIATVCAGRLVHRRR